MSQCVPSWDVDDNLTLPRVPLRSHSNSTAPDVPMLDYEVAELTWENGQISMQGLGVPRVPAKPITAAAGNNTRPAVSTSPSKYSWEKPRGGGTLESIVNQATSLPSRRSKTFFDSVGDGGGDGDDLVPWMNPHRAAADAAASNNMTMDALVPCSNRTDEHSTHSAPGIGTCMVGSSTRVGSSSGRAGTRDEDAALLAAKRARVARVPIVQTHEWSSMDQNQSMSGSATFGRESQQITIDTCDKDIGAGFTSTSMDSPGNTSSAKQGTKNTTADDHDSVCHSRPQGDGDQEDHKKKGTRKSSVSTKSSRAAAIHNQSERKRRDKINQRMKTLQKLVPNSSKIDKASMLDEVIEYLKQLQAQVQMMSRMNMSPMMLPMTIPQQLQMSMMAAPMGMGLGMGMGMGMSMDMNTMGRPNIPGMPPVLHPSAFMPMASWDASGAACDRLQGTPATMMPDLLSTFLACQSQPMTMDSYNRLAAMYQQLHQPPAPSSKN